MNKIRYIEKYPYYLNQLICKKLYSQSCSLIKFAIGNINPFLKAYISGNHRSKSLYENIEIKKINKTRN